MSMPMSVSSMHMHMHMKVEIFLSPCCAKVKWFQKLTDVNMEKLVRRVSPRGSISRAKTMVGLPVTGQNTSG